MGRNATPTIELKQHVDEAYRLLTYATETSAQLPGDVLAAIAAANEAVTRNGAFNGLEDETRFWNAYSVLFSNRLADRARRTYRYLLYGLLAVLLGSQIYFLAGSLIVANLAQVEDEWQASTAQMMAASAAPATQAAPQSAALQAAAPAEAGNAAPSGASQSWLRLRRFAISHANYYLGTKLLPGFQGVPAGSLLVPAGFDREKAQFMVDYMKLRAELQLILISLSGYILPLLYGALGAFAYVLRKLSDPVTKFNFAHDTWSNYTFRLHIGALGGLAVGWFVNGNQPVSGIGSLSPLALAFAAGYGSDLLFAMLDKIVGAFSTPTGLQSQTKTETTQRGGITYSTEIQRRAELSSTPAEAVAEPGRPNTNRL